MSTPIPNEKRISNYRRQTGRPELTPRQQRRIDHKEGRLSGSGEQRRRPPSRER